MNRRFDPLKTPDSLFLAISRRLRSVDVMIGALAALNKYKRRQYD